MYTGHRGHYFTISYRTSSVDQCQWCVSRGGDGPTKKSCKFWRMRGANRPEGVRSPRNLPLIEKHNIINLQKWNYQKVHVGLGPHPPPPFYHHQSSPYICTLCSLCMPLYHLLHNIFSMLQILRKQERHLRRSHFTKTNNF